MPFALKIPRRDDAPAPSAPGVHPTPLWSLRPQSDRQAGDAIVSNFLLHWFPAKVVKASLDWTYSFWLGTVSAALLLLLVLSGLPLLFLYVPSVERAYQSVKDIEYVVAFGAWIRSVHRLPLRRGGSRPQRAADRDLDHAPRALRSGPPRGDAARDSGQHAELHLGEGSQRPLRVRQRADRLP